MIRTESALFCKSFVEYVRNVTYFYFMKKKYREEPFLIKMSDVVNKDFMKLENI